MLPVGTNADGSETMGLRIDHGAFPDPEQKRVAEAYIAQLERVRAFDTPIATEIVPLERFFEAEDYHHDYAARNPNQPYIRAVSDPKVKKLKALHRDLLKGAATT